MLNRETDDSANLARNIYLSYSICHVIRINLGLFTLSRLELQVEARKGDDRAKRVLHFREDSNFSMITILWGNVGVNVILALLSETAMTGFAAFLFSTVIITVFAEILPQSYFSRHALKLTALLSPVLKLYQFILCPLVRPTAWVLDYWLSGEVISYLRKRDSSVKLGEVIKKFQARPGIVEDDIIENDVILLWNHKPRIVTGTDILGRLLRGIARPPSFQVA